MDREALVYVDLDGTPNLVGRLWGRARKNKESASFEYDRTWLENPARFSLELALTLGPGPYHTVGDAPMFGAIGDSAPDRWGRTLMRRMERRRAEREKQVPRSLQEMDYLLLVDDEARQGALRFAEHDGGPFVREEGEKRIPPVIELRRLLSAAEHVMDETDTDQDLRLLFAPGTSLGARARRHPSEIRAANSPLRNFRAATMKSTPWPGKPSPCGSQKNLASWCRPRASRPSRTSPCCCSSASTGKASAAFRFFPP